MSDAKKLYFFSIARFASLILLCVIADLRLIFHDIPAFRPLLWLGCLMLLIFFLLDRHTKILSERNPPTGRNATRVAKTPDLYE